jgi:hypothetical protein
MQQAVRTPLWPACARARARVRACLRVCACVRACVCLMCACVCVYACVCMHGQSPCRRVAPRPDPWRVVWHVQLLLTAGVTAGWRRVRAQTLYFHCCRCYACYAACRMLYRVHRWMPQCMLCMLSQDMLRMVLVRRREAARRAARSNIERSERRGDGIGVGTDVWRPLTADAAVCARTCVCVCVCDGRVPDVVDGYVEQLHDAVNRPIVLSQCADMGRGQSRTNRIATREAPKQERPRSQSIGCMLHGASDGRGNDAERT